MGAATDPLTMTILFLLPLESEPCASGRGGSLTMTVDGGEREKVELQGPLTVIEGEGELDAGGAWILLLTLFEVARKDKELALRRRFSRTIKGEEPEIAIGGVTEVMSQFPRAFDFLQNITTKRLHLHPAHG